MGWDKRMLSLIIGSLLIVTLIPPHSRVLGQDGEPEVEPETESEPESEPGSEPESEPGSEPESETEPENGGEESKYSICISLLLCFCYLKYCFTKFNSSPLSLKPMQFRSRTKWRARSGARKRSTCRG